jgi:hypothetical protein
MEQRNASSKDRELTLREVIDIVSRCSRTSRETAAVINHLLQSAQLRFANGAPRTGAQRLLA